MSNKFGGKERLKGKKLIEKLFREGKSVTAYPLKIIYINITFDDSTILKTGFSVGKRHFKSAVDRNRIKRLMRETYRLNKDMYLNNIQSTYAFMILYLGKDGTDFETVQKNMKKILSKLSDQIAQP